jgi:DNA-binding NarL/FixJ family response regulator
MLSCSVRASVWSWLAKRSGGDYDAISMMGLDPPSRRLGSSSKQIVRDSPRANVLVVTMYEDDESVFAALRAGARGYLLKGANQNETLRAIHAVANGEAIFGPSVAAPVMSYFAAPALREARVFPELTEREHEILQLIARGATNETIADTLD